MKIAIDPYMLRTVPLTELPGVVADLGYEYIELSPRDDFTPFFLHPRASADRVREFKVALDTAGVQVASHLPLHHMAEIMDYAGPLLTHLHLADSFDHRASSGNRCIINPPGSAARIHQHLDIGQGEVDWDEFFGSLARTGFDGIATVCVFAWEDRARESCTANLSKVREYLAKYF